MARSLVVGLWYFNTPPETDIAPENGWLEYYCPFGAWPIFKCELLVLGRVYVAFSEMSGDSLSWNGWGRCCVMSLHLFARYSASHQTTFLWTNWNRLCPQTDVSNSQGFHTWDDGTPWMFNSSPPKNCRAPKGTYIMYIVFQPFSRGYVNLQGCWLLFGLCSNGLAESGHEHCYTPWEGDWAFFGSTSRL